ncbi:unnamed protein product [Parnassius apollo]|uniref:(apollo) hypothetical protein n=1 Tax=Parnassius apollo TaxID=110799 RepID=A0A8S3XT21_PARAO|nr:unnamed protein product [Parnassius apollo]
MNVSTVGIDSIQTIDIPDYAASSTPSPSLSQECNSTVDPRSEIVLPPGKATICELSKPHPQVSVAPIVVSQESTKTSENIIHSEVCSTITLEPETVSLKASSTLEPDATNNNIMHPLKSDALLPGTSKIHADMWTVMTHRIRNLDVQTFITVP